MKVLANDGISESGIDKLEEYGFDVDLTKVSQEQLVDYINNNSVSGLLVRSATQVRKDIIDNCKSLKIIGRGGVGMDNIDVEYAKSKDELVEEKDQARRVEKNVSTSSTLEKERKRKEAEERNLRYKNLKPLEARLEEVEKRLETLMVENEKLQSELVDSGIYEADQKDRLMKTMEQQRNLNGEEQTLIKEWDELTLSIEEIQKIACDREANLALLV